MLKKTLPFKDDLSDKFKTNYEGSYLINKMLSCRVLTLSAMDASVLLEPFNSEFVKNYFV